MKKVKLFGNAIEINFPTEFEDISKVRQVPDNQEVYVSNLDDSSIVVELLEKAPVEDKDICSYLFNDLKDFNEAKAARLLNDQSFTNQFYIIKGEQKGELRLIEVYLGVRRLQDYNTDVLITLNTTNRKNYYENFKLLLKSFKLTDPKLFG
eukprot:snap_masked-scaffold_32-processed-gene-2.38-mRNA-1 protein AED:1.00 eAED:1.00 QI:0/0/0/0/1/1/2/0/150